ncbi:hypothetical protein [Streptomyces sp. NPDC051572]|uniref:hypothetical protein n=1 Tax=Streptomyces sp. NPDC051572 TaxID=3155802 RepID=UPI00344DEC09
MLISELIRLLEERREETGDVEVEVFPYSDCATFPVATGTPQRGKDGRSFVLLDTG